MEQTDRIRAFFIAISKWRRPKRGILLASIPDLIHISDSRSDDNPTFSFSGIYPCEILQSLDPMPISNPEAKEDRGRKRKRESSSGSPASTPRLRWRTDAVRRIYSSKLLEALRRLRRSSPASPPRTRCVREAADRALAVAARGRTRWSRAILSKPRPARAAASCRPRKAVAPVMQERRRPTPTAIRRRARVLGRLVPGCRKASLSTLLEQASDYIAALEMQVRAMSALADMLSSSGLSARLDASPPS